MGRSSPRLRRPLFAALIVTMVAGLVLFALVIVAQFIRVPGPAALVPVLAAAAALAILCAAALYVLTAIRRFTHQTGRAFEAAEQGSFRPHLMRRGDELHALTARLARMLARLDSIDTLRAKRVEFAFRAVHLLHLRMNRPAVLVDPRDNTFRLNEPFQKLYGVEQELFDADAVLNVRANAAFRDLYDSALFGNLRTETGHVEFALPHGEKRRLHTEIIPMGGDDDTVARALILVQPEDSATAAQA